MGRGIALNEELKKKTKTKIEDGAILFFAKYGYEGTKISDLAKSIGISQGLLYRYYPSKEALFEEIISKWIVSRDTNYEALKNAPLSSLEKIRSLTYHLEQSIYLDNKLACIFTIMENRSLVVGLDEVYRQWSTPPILMLEEMIAKGQEEGSCYAGNALQMSVGYWGLFSSICRDYISTGGHIENYDFNLLNRLLIKERGEVL